MSNTTTYSHSTQPDNVNSDASVIKMLDELLAQDNLAIEETNGEWRLFERDPKNPWKTIDFYETRAAAYRGAIDCLLEAVIWDISEGSEL